jgi:hypothetical protein
MVWIVALPTEVAPAVLGEIDPWDLGRTAGVGGVATTAEAADCRFLGQVRSRALPVRRNRFMAPLTVEVPVTGDCLCPGDLVVAGGTRSRHLGWRRIVWVMTADARIHRVVHALHDLRETGRPGGHILVAVKTGLTPLCRDQRPDGVRFVGVFGGRPVADLTGEATVKGPPHYLAMVIVAKDAELPTSVTDLLAGDRMDSVASIVAELAERLRDETGSDNDEGYCEDAEENAQAYHLVRKFPDSQLRSPPSVATEIGRKLRIALTLTTKPILSLPRLLKLEELMKPRGEPRFVRRETFLPPSVFPDGRREFDRGKVLGA